MGRVNLPPNVKKEFNLMNSIQKWCYSISYCLMSYSSIALQILLSWNLSAFFEIKTEL